MKQKKQFNNPYQENFNSIKLELSKVDPVAFAENYLNLDGRPLKLTDNGWKFISDVYRFIIQTAYNPKGKPIVIVKGRQVGATIMASALELYMVASGMFGTNNKPPIRIMHAFPQLELMRSFSKDKLEKMIMESIPITNPDEKQANKLIPYIDAQKNSRSDSGDTLYYKQFKNGNVLWCESIGNEGTRVLGRTFDVCFFDEIQDMSEIAIAKTTKCMTHAQYGPKPGGVQIYFGTPRQKGTFFHKLWEASDQRRYYLGCQECRRYFLLYTPGSDRWEKEIWLHENIVRCPNCGCEQDKVEAVERGKWVATPGREDSEYIGFHFNQLFIPVFTKEIIMREKPDKNPTNSEMIYDNEILGEFHSGAGLPITREEIYKSCRDPDRKYSESIPAGECLTYLGIDWGGKPDIDGVKRGQSFSCGVILSVLNGEILQIEYAEKLKKLDSESKKSFVESMFRLYGIRNAMGDIGFAEDISLDLKQIYGEKYKTVRSTSLVAGGIKYNKEELEVIVEKDKIISEIYDLLRKGKIRFPWASYERMSWLINHCCSMESKYVVRHGQPHQTYVKGKVQNDGLMALIYAYLAYKFDKTRGFKSEVGTATGAFPKPIIAHISKRL